MIKNFTAYNEAYALFEAFYEKLNASITDVPSPLIDSMRYTLGAKGKRLRPVLFIETVKLFGFKPDTSVLKFAAAIETLHNYSLIHDDLPALDNDDYRRGRLTNHRVYGEDIALLAGDALLNRAYELVFQAILGAGDTGCALKAGALFSVLCGASGLIGGQTLDIKGLAQDERMSEDTLDYIYRHKTGDLIAASVLCGALYCGAEDAVYRALGGYAYAFGYAFQLADDLLDAGQPERGASALRLYDEPVVREMLASYTAAAITRLDEVPFDTAFFKALAEQFAVRTV